MPHIQKRLLCRLRAHKCDAIKQIAFEGTHLLLQSFFGDTGLTTFVVVRR